MNEKQSLMTRIIVWFDPRWRSISLWGFIVNRITGLGLTLYLFMHLTMLGNLARGQEAYDGFIHFAHNPIFLVGEVLVVSAGIIHALNGIRIGLNSFGIGLRYQKVLYIGLTALAGIICLYFAYRMFTA